MIKIDYSEGSFLDIKKGVLPYYLCSYFFLSNGALVVSHSA